MKNSKNKSNKQESSQKEHMNNGKPKPSRDDIGRNIASVVLTLVLVLVSAGFIAQDTSPAIDISTVKSGMIDPKDALKNVPSFESLKGIASSVVGSPNPQMHTDATVDCQFSKADEVAINKMSNSYHSGVLVHKIRAKIIAGSEFTKELEELEEFATSSNKRDVAALKEYNLVQHTGVKAIIAELHDEAANAGKNAQPVGVIDSIKNFFGHLFTVKKAEEVKVEIAEHDVSSIVVQLLLDDWVEAAYITASKYKSKSASIGKLVDELSPIVGALRHCDSIKEDAGL